ncbi:uncharacterized protein B0I36DRAFT_435330 [Microdochium trichocladiopsis]|uniref:Uncharacterized protein n=1 Tax=Microdochium trichocladiopsis TaxID=1682393 RepID=A0A9P8XYW1_9PEZI|nr:uncharacterized protein B0I36DRAFT_435330 [Microdochium trichocladiopsis]KAH7021555.1 hypothetical protein B0I36DRAFT_435330 [Microdochium trichocladiopsis]
MGRTAVVRRHVGTNETSLGCRTGLSPRARHSAATAAAHGFLRFLLTGPTCAQDRTSPAAITRPSLFSPSSTSTPICFTGAQASTEIPRISCKSSVKALSTTSCRSTSASASSTKSSSPQSTLLSVPSSNLKNGPFLSRPGRCSTRRSAAHVLTWHSASLQSTEPSLRRCWRPQSWIQIASSPWTAFSAHGRASCTALATASTAQPQSTSSTLCILPIRAPPWSNTYASKSCVSSGLHWWSRLSSLALRARWWLRQSLQRGGLGSESPGRSRSIPFLVTITKKSSG